MTVLDVYFVAAGEKASDRYNIVLIILYCTFSPWAQTWSLKDSRLQKVNVARNNSFRHTYIQLGKVAALCFVAAGGKASNRYNIFVMCYNCQPRPGIRR